MFLYFSICPPLYAIHGNQYPVAGKHNSNWYLMSAIGSRKQMLAIGSIGSIGKHVSNWWQEGAFPISIINTPLPDITTVSTQTPTFGNFTQYLNF